jgi:hypothetical protein
MVGEVISSVAKVRRGNSRSLRFVATAVHGDAATTLVVGG